MTQSLLTLLGTEDERAFEQGWATALKKSPAANDAKQTTSLRRPVVGRQGRNTPASSPGGGLAAPAGTAGPSQPYLRQHEPPATRTHVSNALSMSLSSKLYGAHHLRQKAAIVARQQRDVDAANATAAQLRINQKEIADRSTKLRRELTAVHADQSIMVASLQHRATMLDDNLQRVQAMKSGLTHLLQSQSAKLEAASGRVIDAEEARPQTYTADNVSSQDDTAVPRPVQIAGSADAWSVQLAVREMVDTIAEAEETQAAASMQRQCEDQIQLVKFKIEQLQEQLATERRVPRVHIDYDTCARLRKQIAHLTRQLDQYQRRSSPGHARALQKLQTNEEPEDTGWSSPQKRLVALMNGSFGIPVEDPRVIDALTPFGEVHLVPNPFNENKVAVRAGPSAQHLLFGETPSDRWKTIENMVRGLVERAIETAPVHKPSKSSVPAIWEWRDNAGRRAWHHFDTNLCQRLEVRYTELRSKMIDEQEMASAADTTAEAAEIRWTEPAEDGTATFIIDLERMVQYPERGIVMKDGTNDTVESLSSAMLVKSLVARQPILAPGRTRRFQRELHPLVKAFVREIRRRDPTLGDTSAVHSSSNGTVSPKAAVLSSLYQTSRSKERETRSMDLISKAAVREAVSEAEKLGRRDRALPVGTRLWVEDIGYCWYESYERNPRWSGAPRRGPATHGVRVLPESTDHARPVAGRLHKIHLVGSDAPRWSVEPLDRSYTLMQTGGGRRKGAIEDSRRWHSHQTTMGLGYTRYEFSRFQFRQEQVGKRDVVAEPRFWMDTTAYCAVEDLSQVEEGGDSSAADAE